MPPRRRIDAPLIVGLALGAGSLALASPLPAALATLVIALALAWSEGRAGVALLVGLAFLVGAVRSSGAIARFEIQREAALRNGLRRTVFEGTVARSPVRRGDALRVDVARADPRGGLVTLHLRDGTGPADLGRGDRVAAVADLAPPYRFANGEDPRPREARRGVVLAGGASEVRMLERGAGIAAWIDRARARVRLRILATYPGESAAMARALVLGEDDLDDADARAFRRSGLAHLLAVSGMHLVLVVAGLVAALRAILVRVPALAGRLDATRIASALGIPIAWVYEDLAGASGSAVRAAWMITVALLAHALGRRSDAPRALGLSVLGMILVDPLAPYDLSFVLSAAATAGLLALGPPIVAWADASLPRVLAWLARPVAATTSATIACAPLLAILAGELPVAGLVANLVAVPLGEAAALPLCLVHALLAPLPLAEKGAALAASGALGLVRRVARAFAEVPWGAVSVPAPTAGELAVLAVIAFVLATSRARGGWRVLPLVALLLELEAHARRAGAPLGILRVTFLDVGQGDAALVDLPDGSAILVDGGGLVGTPLDVGERVVVPLLRARRRAELRAVILTHPHPDHFGGLGAVLASTRVGALWDTGQGEAEGAGGGYAALLAVARARGVPVRRPLDVCGVHAVGGASLEVLAPCPAPRVERGPNDNSFVVRLAYGRRAFVLAGDAEREEEADLLVGRTPLRADVLKVGHHGSRTSTTAAWVSAVRPDVAVVSCGVRNRFGHPTLATLATLGSAGARILRTDRDGAIAITTDGDRLDQDRSTTPMYGRLR